VTHSVTAFRGVRMPIGTRHDLTVSMLARTLTTPRSVPASKLDAPSWSPCTFRGDQRANARAERLCCLVWDYDDGTTIEAALAPWTGTYVIWHTTWSHTTETPRYRLVLPLAVSVPAKDWRALWGAVAPLAAGEPDRQCRDPSRLYLCAVDRGPFAAGVSMGELYTMPPVPPPIPRKQVRHTPGREVDRVSVAHTLGARISGGIAKGLTCPQCGRGSVYYYLEPEQWDGAACGHRNSCGWLGGVSALVSA